MACGGCSVNPLNVASEAGVKIEDQILFLQRHGVLRQEMVCPRCGQECKLTFNPPCFRCQKDRCRFKRSLKVNTWLNRSHLSFEKVIKFITLWVTLPHPRLSVIEKMLGLSHKTVVDLSKFCREICIDWLVLSGVDIVGGPEITVEVDEVKFGKRKNQMGREVEGSWIFGAFERGTKKCFFQVVKDRSGTSLMEVILQRIAPGTTIMSDLWRGYNSLINQQQIQHLTVNHNLNFVDPATGPQNIERVWREVCSNIPRYGRNKDFCDGYLAEFYWKSRFDLNERTHEFLIEVSHQFNPYI